ncbi:hypothetical protein CEQ90_10010 [Lewinellaceae bacterium SD302]|nr:hypothetical protein CEQ90_10010 [Lewinellaceae bacterium SD302]
MKSKYHNDFKMMQTIHYALLSGILLFAAVAYFVDPVNPKVEGLYDLFRYLVPGLAAMTLLAGRFVTKPIFATAANKESLNAKLDVFRTGMLIRWALAEGAALFAIVAFMLTGNLVMLLVGLALALYLFTLRPSPEAAGAALELSESEYREFF